MQQCAGVIAPITTLVLLPSPDFPLPALLCTTLHLGFAQAVFVSAPGFVLGDCVPLV